MEVCASLHVMGDLIRTLADTASSSPLSVRVRKCSCKCPLRTFFARSEFGGAIEWRMSQSADLTHQPKINGHTDIHPPPGDVYSSGKQKQVRAAALTDSEQRSVEAIEVKTNMLTVART
jgi:hypothetical protein